MNKHTPGPWKVETKEVYPITYSKEITVLIDHNPENNDLGNLLAACQLHHNRYDAAHRAETRRANRTKKIKRTIKDNGKRASAEEKKQP